MQTDLTPDETTRLLILAGTKLYMEMGKIDGDPQMFWCTSNDEVRSAIINLTRLMLQANSSGGII